MPKRILDEEMRFSVIVNGNKAQKELLDLEKSTRSYRKANTELRAEKNKLITQGKKGTAEYKRLTAEIKANNTAITANNLRMKSLQKEIGITGLTMAQLRKRAAQLRIQLNNTIPNGNAYKKYNAELNKINQRMGELRRGANRSKLSLSSLAQGFNKYAVLGASALAGISGVVVGIQKLLDYNGKLSDSQADVMKTTGKTKKEVDALTRSFGILKTRTSRIDLLKIAEEGGRIGVVKEEIQDFVQVMNKANVALGDTFTGGVSEVAAKLGKLKFLFKETKDLGVDLAFNAIGSALNELGANGIATEADIAAFATRVGALPDALKPTIADALGLGTAFSESGLMVEKAGRAYEIFMSTAAVNTDKFANQMGMTKQEVEDLINTNPTEFFLRFSESLADVNDDGVAMSKILKDLGLNATSVKGIVGAAANNTERFRDMIALSNKAMIEGTSLLTEYEIKNNNLAATLLKIKKTAAGWFSSKGLITWLDIAATKVALFIGALDNNESALEKIGNTIKKVLPPLKVLIAGILGYIIAIKAWIAIQKSWLFIMNASKAAVVGYKIAIALLTGNIRKATTYMRLFNIAVKGSPLGWFAAVLSAVIAAYVIFSKRTDEAAKQQKIFNDIQNQATEYISKQRTEVENLLAVAKDESISKAQRLEAIKKLNEISPEYLGNINLETINTLEAKDAIDKYVNSLKLKAIQEAISSEQSKLYARDLAIQRQMDKELEGKSFNDSPSRKFRALVKEKEEVKKEMDWLANEQVTIIKKLGAEKEYLQEEELKKLDTWFSEQIIKAQGNADKILKIQKLFQAKKELLLAPKAKGTGTGTPTGTPTGGATDTSKANELKKEQAELLRLQRQFKDAELSLLDEGYAKEKAKLDEINARKIADLKARKSSPEQLEAAPENVKETLKKKNKQIDDLIEIQEKVHAAKVGTIQAQAGQKELQRIADQYNREKTVRQTNFNNQLAEITTLADAKLSLKESLSAEELSQITTLKDAKQALIDKHNQEEAVKEAEHLQILVDLFQDAVKDMSVNGIDFELLTPEQEEAFKAQIERLKLQISELRKAAGMDGDDPIDYSSSNGDMESLDGAQVDILGFTPTQWDELFHNLSEGKLGVEAIGMALNAMGNLWQQYNRYVEAGENKQLAKYEDNANRRKDILQRQLDNGQISQEQYAERVEKIDTQLDRQKAEIEYQQAKRQKQIAIAQVFSNTAQAIMSIWAQVPKFDFGISAGILTGVVSALGALQVATIARQPLPARGFSEGLYPIEREQDGKIFDSQYGGQTTSGMVSQPTYFLTGENGPEMIIDSAAYKQMDPEVKNSMHREVARVKGFESGYYDEAAQQPNYTQTDTNTSNDALLEAMFFQLQRNNDILERLEANGLSATVSTKDMKSMKNLQEGIKDYNTIRTQSKI